MKIEIALHYHNCQCTNIKKNGKKKTGKQNFQCKTCGSQFIGDFQLSYKGCQSGLYKRIELMIVRNVGNRDIA